MASDSPAAAPGSEPAEEQSWFARDWFWTFLGGLILFEVVLQITFIEADVIWIQALIGLGLVLLVTLILPRATVAVPPKPSAASAVDGDYLAAVRARQGAFMIIVVVGWLAFQLGSVSQLLLLAAVVALVMASGLRPVDAALAAAGAAAFLIFVPVYIGILVPALVAYVAAVWLGTRSDGARWVRRLAAVAVTSAVYVTFNALVGAPFVVFGTILVALVVAVAVAVRALRAKGRFAGVSPPRRAALAGASLLLGFPLAAGAGVALLLWAGWLEQSLGESGIRTKDVRAAGPPFPPVKGSAHEVAERYEPMLVHPVDEPWRPTNVEDYLADARLVDGDEHRPAALVADPAASDEAACRDTAGPECYVTIECPDPDDECAADRDSARQVLYARVVEDPLAREGIDPATAAAPISELERLVQYWVFYRYDDWTAWWLNGFRQWHEADWEMVSVGLGDDGPLFAAFSGHCGGQWRTWDKLGGLDAVRDEAGRLVVDDDLPTGHHVLGFVALGSHAMYPDAGPHAPDWKSCAAEDLPVTVDISTWGPTYAAGLRESIKLGGSVEDNIVGPPLEMVDEDTPWMRFRGRWGAADHFRALWSGGDCPDGSASEGCGKGPDTPALKESWRTPLRAIFCNEYFTPQGTCPP